MMVWMSMELIGLVDVIWWDCGLIVKQITADFCKTIDYHHLDMSRDDGMDEHGID
jgi:hypothetical protein